MTVSPIIQANKSIMIALLVIGRRIAQELSTAPDASIAAVCREHDVNRTYVYEQAARALEVVGERASLGPGRPPSRGGGGPCAPPDLELTIDVLHYRLEHPGSLVAHPRRTNYSPAFQRFILERWDRFDGPLERFARAVRIPPDTLREWLERDAKGLMPKPSPPRPRFRVPQGASELAAAIARDWNRWQGTTRDFIRNASERFHLHRAQVRRLLLVLGLLPSPRRGGAFRYRRSTQKLTAGAMAVTDGKQLAIHLTASDRWESRTWQAVVDQSSGCDLAAVLTPVEGARSAGRAFAEALAFLGGVAPQGLLHDNKPCYHDAALRRHIEAAGTLMVPATPNRPQNKAILEGAFQLFESRVGPIELDDTNPDTLLTTAAREVVRAYTAATNGVPRQELDGRSRLGALRQARPSLQQKERDRAFIRRLQAKHESQRRSRWRTKTKEVSRRLLDHVFERLGLLRRDPGGRLRQYLSLYEPAAIRRAAAVVAAGQARGHLRGSEVDRYLAKVIRAKQEELDLERAAEELLALSLRQGELWTEVEESELADLVAQHAGASLARELARRAAFAGLPVAQAFWTQELLAMLDRASHLTPAVITFLIRLYESPPDRRLALIDRLTALQQGLT